MEESASIIIDDFKCIKCGECLSREPVLLDKNGSGICGRCPAPEDGSIENPPYNEMAKMLSFPCKYRPVGCLRFIPFKSVKKHEDACAYGPSDCPFAVHGTCGWLGHSGVLYEHCLQHHPEVVVHNGFMRKNNINVSQKRKFLMKAYDVLFLISDEICRTTEFLYHSVQVIGDPQFDQMFYYEVIVHNGGDSFTKLRRVMPYGCENEDEELVEKTPLLALLDILNGYTSTSFIIKTEAEVMAERALRY